MKTYEDIINLPHHVSKKHPQISRESRAAQFAPFAALTGYGDAVEETARITGSRIELGEEMKAIINDKLNIINLHIKERPQVTLTYFVPDVRKDGGSYISTTDNVRRIDLANNVIVLSNRKKINISDIIGVKIDEDNFWVTFG